MRQLLIETSTERGVIACLDGPSIIFLSELPFGLNQSRFLLPDLAKALSLHAIDPQSLTCIGVGIGPGSYTGIRIGVAVAQALAYAWDLPLVGVCSLNAFVPKEQGINFASIFDARIGGVYVRKGVSRNGYVEYYSEPCVCALEDLKPLLNDVTHLVTPSAKNIKEKIDLIYPGNPWSWVESTPSVSAFSRSVTLAYNQGDWKKEEHLELLYLRETEAERTKNQPTKR